MGKEDSLFQWERVQRFNFSVWTVLTGTLIARTSFFMAWPFLIVFLYQDYGASAIEVGGNAGRFSRCWGCDWFIFWIPIR